MGKKTLVVHVLESTPVQYWNKLQCDYLATSLLHALSNDFDLGQFLRTIVCSNEHDCGSQYF